MTLDPLPRLYRHLNQRGSLDFLAEVRRRLPFAVRRRQSAHGVECAFAIVLAVEQAGIRRRGLASPPYLSSSSCSLGLGGGSIRVSTMSSKSTLAELAMKR